MWFSMTMVCVIFGLLNGVFMCDWHVFDDSADWIPYIICKEYEKVLKDRDVFKYEAKKIKFISNYQCIKLLLLNWKLNHIMMYDCILN